MKWSEILGYVGFAVGAAYGAPGVGKTAGSMVGNIVDDPGEAFGGGPKQGGAPTGDAATTGADDKLLGVQAALAAKAKENPGMSRGNPDWWSALGKKEEEDFQKWFSGYARLTGNNSNPDDPEHRYNYRAMWRASQESDQFKPAMDPTDGLYHGSSLFKSWNHPNRYVKMTDGRFLDSITGEVGADERFLAREY